MRNLLFHEMMILSRTEKKATRVTFAPKKNILLGDNDVGKSTLIKSLYHTLGAATPHLGNNRWKGAKAIYVLKFSVDQKKYTLLRDERHFGLFDEHSTLISKHHGISGDDGIATAINSLLKFNIKLEGKDGKLRRLGPAYYFLPFYVDQDEGWNQTWASFSGLQAVKDYRRNMLDYHLGIKPQNVHDALNALHLLNQEFGKLSEEKNTLLSVREGYARKKEFQKTDLSPEAFKAEIESLVQQYNDFLEIQQSQLNLIKDARNEIIQIENEIKILEASINELEADYTYAELPSTADHVGCPTCGTEFENSFAERFSILDDADYCRNLIDQRRKELILSSEKLQKLELGYSRLSEDILAVDEVLKKEKEKVTFADIIASEGFKDIMNSISQDVSNLDTQQVEIETKILNIEPSTKPDKDLKKKLTSFYQSRMKSALNKLNVYVLTENDYKTPGKVIKNNALGSDLPRSLLAQYISYLQTMIEFNSFSVCPLVIDSPLQQEQDDTNANAIFKFIFSNTLKNQQLVLGTLTLDDLNLDDDLLTDCNVIKLEDKYSLLSERDYLEINKEITPLHDVTLSVGL